eukprot:TRINITY_DN8239_c0_g1_i1.p1 TRINITY_DN8239_c0_g1~~TRINITY_DN8239_c0_g1_i1.p1  ORF type:complete len:177 (+),score=32.19 TRINITY_DN8239_c0_g1_i1:1-531(+)
MATALAGGVINAGLVNPTQVIIYDVMDAALERGKNKGFQIAGSNWEVGQVANIIFLAVKPSEIPSVLGELRGVPDIKANKPLIISIAAGITLKNIESTLDPVTLPVIRVMPNTPCLVGETAAAFALGRQAKRKHAGRCDDIVIYQSFPPLPSMPRPFDNTNPHRVANSFPSSPLCT